MTEDDPEVLLARALAIAADLDPYEDESDREQEVEDLLRRAAEHGLVRAMAELGAFLWHFWGDDDGAYPWLLRAAEAGEADAMSRLGDIHDFRDEPREAIAWYEKAAALGDQSAAGNLAAYRQMGIS
jgi:TPR repeat protein